MSSVESFREQTEVDKELIIIYSKSNDNTEYYLKTLRYVRLNQTIGYELNNAYRFDTRYRHLGNVLHLPIRLRR